MLPELSSVSYLTYLGPLLFLLATTTSAFLFWRAGRYEYIESSVLFDILVLSAFGGLIFSRLFDFVFNFRAYDWSFARLLFFNAYGSFDVWGALLGAILVTYLYLRKRKTNFWLILDLSAAPIVFAIFIYSLSHIPFGIYDSLGYLILFIFLKRLETQKRHKGFFACFAVAGLAIINVAFFLRSTLFDYMLIKPIGFFMASLFTWYFLSKRRVTRDTKGLFGSILLGAFGIKRVVSDIREADNLAKSIILSPFYFGKRLVFFVRLLGRETVLAANSFVHFVGFKK